MINYSKNAIYKIALMLFASFLMLSCDEDPETPTVEEPFADFSLEVDEANTLTVNFTNSSIDGESYSWDFGDDSGTSTEENPSYTYAASGTYTVELTVTNSAGSSSSTEEVTVSGFGPNLLTNGDMEAENGWTSRPLWTAEDNATNHRYEDGAFIFQNAENPDGGFYQWSNHAFFQEVELTAGSTYQFNAQVSSTSGTMATWFEVYLVKEEPVNEDNIGGDATQLAIKSFGEGENCTATEFSGSILEIAAECSGINDFPLLIDEDGYFTVSEGDLSANGTLFLVFKAGSGFAPEGETAGFRDGLILDDVVIKEVL
ncbi:PKD domain-containing protein [Marivirga harenae]|uniref:PKD domain-containing protein n=1 Tax=Marivirga harenae TaxID=2010992 RepID=UPI0026E08D6D|nr:PKD domain-containing protein [Marivirga harenae]WKV11400.1 PKD domain-containing protein [Marivirga harenae]